MKRRSRGSARGGPAPAPAPPVRDRFGRFAASKAAARRAKAPPPTRRDAFGRFRSATGPAPAPPTPVHHRNKLGQFARGRITTRDKVRDLPGVLNVDAIPESDDWTAPQFLHPLDRSTNETRFIVAVVLGYFLDPSPDGFGGSEEDPITRHFPMGYMSGLEALALTEADVRARVLEYMARKPFHVQEVLAVLQRDPLNA